MIAKDVFTTLLITSTAFAQPDKPRWEPIPICDDCVPRELIVAPGVGIDLTSSYGTAAVRFNNKSMVNIDQIYGNKKYNAIIKELSGPADPEKYPKYGNILDELRDIWRKNQRRLRKLRGLPATPEVGIIGDLIKQLHTATEARLDKPITSAVLATPRLPRVTDEDLDDAMEYAGLKSLKSYRTWTYVSEPQATFAGMGFGLCEKWGDMEKCEDEEATFPVAHVLSVTFTHDVLSVTYITAQDARTVSFGSTTTRYDLGLGTWLQNPGSPTYWNEIREAIRRIAIISLPLIDYLLLSGEDATDEQFLKTVKEALLPTSLGNAPRIVRTSIDPPHVGAQGAAEFAKRWQGGTWNCMEPPRCAGNWQPGDDGRRGSWSELREEL